MKRKLLMLLAMCAFTIAMVPRDKPAVNTEKEKQQRNYTIPLCGNYKPCDCLQTVYRPGTGCVFTCQIIYSGIGDCRCAVGPVYDQAEDTYDRYRCLVPTLP